MANSLAPEATRAIASGDPAGHVGNDRQALGGKTGRRSWRRSNGAVAGIDRAIEGKFRPRPGWAPSAQACAARSHPGQRRPTHRRPDRQACIKRWSELRASAPPRPGRDAEGQLLRRICRFHDAGRKAGRTSRPMWRFESERLMTQEPRFRGMRPFVRIITAVTPTLATDNGKHGRRVPPCAGRCAPRGHLQILRPN